MINNHFIALQFSSKQLDWIIYAQLSIYEMKLMNISLSKHENLRYNLPINI